jgi:5-(carboxyamino)imidazole ribonucleotide mutase
MQYRKDIGVVDEWIGRDAIDDSASRDEPGRTVDPVVAFERVRAGERAIEPEPVTAPERVMEPEPVTAREWVTAPEPVMDAERFMAAEPVIERDKEDAAGGVPVWPELEREAAEPTPAPEPSPASARDSQAPRQEDTGDGRDDGSTVAVVVGSANDLKKLDEARDVFDWFGIVYEVHVASAHRAPRRVLALAEDASERGIKVFIAGAGKAAALPGVLAAATTLPVIGVPFSSPDLGGMDALLSAVQMPRGVPVATVAIDGVANAAILAAEICALSDARLARRLVEFKGRLADGADVMRLVRGEDDAAQRDAAASAERSRESAAAR